MTTKEEYKRIADRVRYAKFRYLCARKSKKKKWQIIYNLWLHHMKTFLAFNIEEFQNNKYINRREL